MNFSDWLFLIDELVVAAKPGFIAAMNVKAVPMDSSETGDYSSSVSWLSTRRNGVHLVA